VPGGFGVRFDSHVHAGYIVSPMYDSMIGKLIVIQPTRMDAINSMRRCLKELVVDGIKTSKSLQIKILESKEFQSGQIDTLLIERKFIPKSTKK
jgi:acetyl-CoA carboxylase biotin carboxylase subunit